MKEETSEFGMGFVYNLVLFAKHWELGSEEGGRSWWFNGSSDHLYELQVPCGVPDKLRLKIEKWRDTVLDRGHGSGVMKICGADCEGIEKEIDDCFEELEEICREIDKWLKVKSIKADYE